MLTEFLWMSRQHCNEFAAVVQWIDAEYAYEEVDRRASDCTQLLRASFYPDVECGSACTPRLDAKRVAAKIEKPVPGVRRANDNGCHPIEPGAHFVD